MKRGAWRQSYLDYAAEITDAPIIFHKYTALSLAASALEDRIYFKFGDQMMRPNLWICMVAGSSVARKSTSLSIGKRIYEAGIGKQTYPDEFSQEAFIEMMSAQPGGCIFASEFINLVSCMKKDYNAGMMGFLADIYDSPPHYRRTLIKREYYINNPSLNILAATTVEWFLERLTPDDWSGGFVPRFLLIPFLKERENLMALPPPACPHKKQRVANGLRLLTKSHGELYFEPDVRRQYEAWYEKHSNRGGLPSRFLGSYHRMAVMAIKLAMIIECLESPATTKTPISGESLLEATDCIDEASKLMCGLVEDNLAFTKYEKERALIIGIIKREGGTLDHSSLLKRSKMPGRQFNSIIDTMLECSELERSYVNTPTKKKTVYELR